MGQAFNMLYRALENLIALLLAAMVVLVFGNVVLRYGFNSGITVSEELSRWFFIWATFLGAIVAMRDRSHLGVDMLVSRLPAWGKRLCLIVSHLIMLFIVWMFFTGSLAQTRINWEVSAPTSGYSMAWVYGVGCVFACLAAPLLMLDLWRILSGQLADDELVMVQESEETANLDQILGEKRAGSSHTGVTGR